MNPPVKDSAPIPGYPEPYGLLCGILQDASFDWRAELEGDLSPETIAWRPRPGGPSIGAIMLHMIIVEVFWLEVFVLGERPSEEDKRILMWYEIDVDEPRWPDPHPHHLSWYFDLADRYRERTLEAVKRWPASDVLLERQGEEMKYTPRWVLGHVIQHETYHGGQIVMLHDLWKSSSSR